MLFFELNIQISLAARLQSSTDLSAIVGDRVYDKPPQVNDDKFGVDYPYVVIGEDTYSAYDTDDCQGVEGTLKIEFFSIKGTFEELKTIHGVIRGLLDRHRLDVDDMELVDLTYDSSQSVRDSDPKILHGTVLFNLIGYAS